MTGGQSPDSVGALVAQSCGYLIKSGDRQIEGMNLLAVVAETVSALAQIGRMESLKRYDTANDIHPPGIAPNTFPHSGVASEHVCL